MMEFGRCEMAAYPHHQLVGLECARWNLFSHAPLCHAGRYYPQIEQPKCPARAIKSAQMRSFCVAPRPKCDARGCSFAFGAIERCIFQNCVRHIRSLRGPKIWWIATLINYEFRPLGTHKRAWRHLRRLCLSVCRTPPTPNPRDQSTRRIKLLPRRKCRSRMYIWEKGMRPSQRSSLRRRRRRRY